LRIIDAEFAGSEMTNHEKTMTANCNIWKMKDQITSCHLNIIIIIYNNDGMATTV